MLRTVVFICALVYWPWVWGIDHLSFKLGALNGHGWQAENVVMQLYADKPLKLTIHIASLQLAQLKQPLKKVQLQCFNAQYTTDQVACFEAQLQWGDIVNAKLSFSYRPVEKHIQFTIKRFVLAGGQITGQAQSTPQGWSAQLKINQVDMEQLRQQLQLFITLPSTWNLAGQSALTVAISHHDQVTQAQINGELTQLSFANAAGSQAGEHLKLEVALTVNAQPSTTQIQGHLTLYQGEIYSEPIYVGIDTTPVTLSIDLRWQPPYLTVHQFNYHHLNVLLLKGTAQLMTQPQWHIQQLELQLQSIELKKFYQYYLQAWLGAHWRVSGSITAYFNMSPEHQQLEAQLTQVKLEHTEKKMGLIDVQGTIQWHNSEKRMTQLQWSRAYLSALTLGPSQLRAQLSGRNIQLLETWRQPILDGQLLIEQFSLSHFGKDDIQWQLQAQLQSISLTQLTQQFQWPPLPERITLTLPQLHYAQQQLEMKTPLTLPIFEGKLMISSWQLKWTEVPILTIQRIELDKLNLHTMTQMTQFGAIQGQLSGYVKQLQFVNWQPVSFDAYLATPEDNRLPKKISQKAIENLTHLGGNGAINNLSRIILSLFEQFSYARLGLGCRLEKGICHMSGVEARDEGYYIVKGRGLPRIDVIGYIRQVDWTTLLNRLRRVTEKRTAIIQ